MGGGYKQEISVVVVLVFLMIFASIFPHFFQKQVSSMQSST